MTRKTALRFTLAVVLASTSGSALAAPAQVDYVDPDSFTDAGRRYALSEREGNLDMLRRHLVERAARVLPPGETLSVSVTDVDLAGAFEPWRRALDEIRIVRDIYPPRIDLRFRLVRADGSVVKEGERTLRDAGFLMGATRHASDALRYERTLLDDWLEREFGRPR